MSLLINEIASANDALFLYKTVGYGYNSIKSFCDPIHIIIATRLIVFSVCITFYILEQYSERR